MKDKTPTGIICTSCKKEILGKVKGSPKQPMCKKCYRKMYGGEPYSFE